MIAWDQPLADAARAFYAAVVKLARTEPALIGRDLHPVKTSAPRNVIAYRRGNLVILVNARSRPAKFAVSGVQVSGARDLLSNTAQRGDTVALPGHGTLVLKGALKATPPH